MNSDGSNQVNLSNTPSSNEEPGSWSPDGSKLAFSTFRGGNNEVYVMNADGSGQVNLTNNSAADRHLAWSAEGAKIAFTRGNDIFVMNADGTGQAGVFTSPGRNWEPAWKP